MTNWITPETLLIAFQVVIFTLMVFGLFGLFTMVVPGLVVIWAGALVYGLVTGFTWGNGVVFFFLTGLMIFGSVIDNILMGSGARQTGSSWWSITLALVAGLIGSLVLPIIGGLLVACLALFLSEAIRRRNESAFLGRDWNGALQATRSMMVGCGWSVVFRLIIGAVMILLWILWALLWTPAI